MNRGLFQICGVTPEACLPHCEPESVSHICETDIITIHCQDPDIQEIIRLDVSVCLRSFKIIKSPVGKKLVIHAVKNVELAFRACGIRYASKFCIPFCTFIILDCEETEVKDIRFTIEDIDAIQTSVRSVAVSSLIMVVPEYSEMKHDVCECDSKGIRCDIRIKSAPDRKHLPGNYPPGSYGCQF